MCAHAPERVHLLFESLSLDRPGLAAVKAPVQTRDLPAACTALVEYYRKANTAAWLRVASAADSTSRSPDADPARADSIDAAVREWILAHPHPGRLMTDGPWNGVEVSARALRWMHTFYGLQACDAFSPAARILMLSSLVDHANYLMLFHRRTSGNALVTELDGLGTIGAAWPEFIDAPGWRKYALEWMVEQMDEQVYPDGAHTELASVYHRIAAEQFDAFATVLSRCGYPVPAPLEEGIDRMWSYLALIVRPDGTSPENNDSDRRDLRETLVAAATEHRRGDWLFAATHGEQGAPPRTGPSAAFPWAGQLVMRSGWDADAQWAFFDAGPYGTAHQHRDKLHLSIDAFGRALLVDAGRLDQERGPWREYFTGSSAHNVILIDGGGQKADVVRADRPLGAGSYTATPEFDFARGVFTAGFTGVHGVAIHTRAVVYVKNEFWVVADRIETDRPRALDALWHFAPDCHVRIDGRDAVSDDTGLGNLRVAPVGGMRWSPSLVSGDESPIQGWYSPSHDEKVPETVAVFHAELPGTTTFAWVLVPARGEVPAVDARVISSRAERIELRVQTRPDYWFVLAIPMNEWKPTVRRES